jgi:hypothetical protein
MPTLRDQEE